MTKSQLATELYKAFRDYVDKNSLSEYDNGFLNRKKINEKLIVNLLKKHVDLEMCSRNPKKKHDSLIINYALVELPTNGLVRSKLLNDYLRKERQYQRKNVAQQNL